MDCSATTSAASPRPGSPPPPPSRCGRTWSVRGRSSGWCSTCLPGWQPGTLPCWRSTRSSCRASSRRSWTIPARTSLLDAAAAIGITVLVVLSFTHGTTVGRLSGRATVVGRWLLIGGIGGWLGFLLVSRLALLVDRLAFLLRDLRRPASCRGRGLGCRGGGHG